MKKSALINEYIQRCESIILKNDLVEADKLEKEIIGVFEKEIDNITLNLDSYSYSDPNASRRQVDYMGDLNLLKAKLTNYKANIESEKENRAQELEVLKLKQSMLHITNTNTNTNESSSNASAMLAVTIEQTIENITNIPADILSEKEKEELEEKLAAVELVKKSDNKEKIYSKIGGVLKYIGDKSIDVAIAVLPYLGEVSKGI